MNPFSQSQIENVAQLSEVPLSEALRSLGHSLLVGFVLMMVSVYLAKRVQASKFGAKVKDDLNEGLLASANVLYLCFGITGLMILVNNNLARAFAVGAAIALVRFKVKFKANISSSLYFAVITGLGCGVGQIEIAWGMTLVFATIQLILVSIVARDRET